MKLDFNYEINFESLKECEQNSFKVVSGEDTALFIVDMNKGFAKSGALASESVEAIIPNIVDVTTKFKNANAPIVAFTDYHTEDAVEFKSFPAHCIGGTEEAELVDELKEFENDITLINKNSTNGFLEEDAQKEIKSLIEKGVKNWVVTGCCTDICVMSFATTLKEYFNKENLDLNVVIPMDAVETYDAPWHNKNAMNLFALTTMKAAGIQIVGSVE